MIKIENFDKGKGKLSLVTDMPLSLANAIRRSVLEIPTMAIDEAEIIKNDSALFDEIIAHRLGLCPIKSFGKEQKFKLRAKGPCTVYSTDLSPSTGVDSKLPIVILADGQELELNANANLGTGVKHIKYSPGLMYYKHNLDEEILDLINLNEEGKIDYDEEELKRKGFSEEQISALKKLKDISELKLFIESWGQIEVKDIFTKAIDVLDKNLTELNKSVK